MPLSTEEFLEHLVILGLSLEDTARILGVPLHTVRLWASDMESVPEGASIALVLMVEFKVDPWRFVNANPGD